MAELQTVYNDTVTAGFPGMVANGETSNRISRTISDAAGIAFGKAAFRSADEHTATATPAAGQFLGITIAHNTLGFIAGQSVDTYPQYENIAIMTLGAIFVTAGEAVAKGDQAYVTGAGALVKTASGNTILPGWAFDEAAAGGAIAKLVKR